MTSATADEAAAILWKLWSEGETIATLPELCRPATLDEAWLVQRALDELAGDGIGWKIAATSAAGQAHIGADGPVVGRLYECCLVDPGTQLDARALTMRAAEAEFAFRLAEDLPIGDEPFRHERVLAAASLSLAIEVPDTRFSDFASVGLPSLVADAMCAGFLVVGPAIDSWEPAELPDVEVTMHRNGEPVADGAGRDVLGDPCEALTWLANELRDHGQALRRGDVVITGGATPANPVAPGDRLEAHFDGHGVVAVGFLP